MDMHWALHYVSQIVCLSPPKWMIFMEMNPRDTYIAHSKKKILGLVSFLKWLNLAAIPGA